MEQSSKNFAVNLRNRRRCRKLTQKQLADRIGYSEKSISKWESGAAIAPSVVLPDLAGVLGVSIDELFDSAMEPVYYLGIDGGGTKTEFALADKSGRLLSSTVIAGCNPVDIGLDATFDILRTGIAAVCRDILPEKISVFAGIAGGMTGDNRQRIHDFLAQYRFAAADNGSDAQNAVAACLGKADGIVVIIGTGDVTFAQRDGQLQRMGGFGYLFDEGGSGYAIGRDAILAALKAEEGTGGPTQIVELFKKRLASEKIFDSLSLFYKGGKRKIASYAPLVFEAANAGDATALRILNDNFSAVAAYIRKAAERFPHHQRVKVVLAGGITNQSGTVLPLLDSLMENNLLYDISVNNQPLVNGALLLAGMPRRTDIC